MSLKNRIVFSCALLLIVTLFAACNRGGDEASGTKELPTIKIGYIFTTNHTPLIVALSRGDDYSAGGYSFSPIVPKEVYEFRKEGKPIANVEIVVAKSGSEVGTLIAQGHLDMSLGSITAIIAAIDKDVPMKIVAPLVLVSGGMVVPADSPVNDWPSFVNMLRQSKTPVNIGYHSPTSAPVIITESSLLSEGVKTSRDPNDRNANAIMVDLRETANMIPALVSRQVDAVVGPAPFPQNAVHSGVGKFISELRDMTPEGKWSNYPCCVVVAGTEMISKNPELVRDFVAFITASSLWSNEHGIEAGETAAAWLGMEAEVGRTLNHRFVAEFSDAWKESAAGYMEVLEQGGNFNGILKGKTFKEAEDRIIDSRFIGKH